MAQKNFNTRIQLKNDIESNWSQATNFVPLKGEIIIYNKDYNYDYERIKIGDGATTVTNLPFCTERFDDIIEKLKRKIIGEVTVGHLGQIEDINREDFQLGQKYGVIMDGVLYTATCQREGEEDPVDFIGNPAIALPEVAGTERDTDEPFIVLIFGNNIVFGFADEGSHKISIYVLNELDEVLSKSNEAFIIRQTENGIDKTGAEIYQAYLQNRPIYAYGQFDGMSAIAYPLSISEELIVFTTTIANRVILITLSESDGLMVQEFNLVTDVQLLDEIGIVSNVARQYTDEKFSSITAITTAEIDAICGSSIYAASEVDV